MPWTSFFNKATHGVDDADGRSFLQFYRSQDAQTAAGVNIEVRPSTPGGPPGSYPSMHLVCAQKATRGTHPAR